MVEDDPAAVEAPADETAEEARETVPLVPLPPLRALLDVPDVVLVVLEVLVLDPEDVPVVLDEASLDREVVLPVLEEAVPLAVLPEAVELLLPDWPELCELRCVELAADPVLPDADRPVLDPDPEPVDAVVACDLPVCVDPCVDRFVDPAVCLADPDPLLAVAFLSAPWLLLNWVVCVPVWLLL